MNDAVLDGRRIERRRLLGAATAAGLLAALPRDLARAEPAQGNVQLLAASSNSAQEVPRGSADEQMDAYGYEIGWEDGPIGNVTLCIERNLLEAPTNWMHKIELNTDPETGYLDASERLNAAIRFGMYRAWQSNKPDKRADVTFDEFVENLLAGKNMKFRAKGRRGLDPFPSMITINPAEPVRLVWLGTDGFGMHHKYTGLGDGFTSHNGETRLMFYNYHYFVPGNGDYGGDAERYQMHRTQAAGMLVMCLAIMAAPELQEPGFITDDLENRYITDAGSIAQELNAWLYTVNEERTDVTNWTLNVS